MPSEPQTTKGSMPQRRPRKQATVRDVAREAGVSIATVSRAIAQPALVRIQTRERIDQAIKHLNYVSDGLARALSTRRTGTIGAVIPTLDNAIYSVSTHRLQKVLEQSGYTLLLACHEFDLASELRIVRAFIQRGVDGIALVGTAHAPATHQLLAAHRVACVYTWATDLSAQTASVGFDNRAAGRLIAEHLLSLGHQHIGVISGVLEGNDRATDRLEGLRQCLQSAGIALPAQAVEQAQYSVQAGADALDRLISRTPLSAVVCGNDVLAIGAIQRARERGIHIPNDLSITGYDDMELARVITPPLTTVHFPIAQVGEETAHHLIERINQDKPARCIQLPIHLVVRGSTARAR